MPSYFLSEGMDIHTNPRFFLFLLDIGLSIGCFILYHETGHGWRLWSLNQSLPYGNCAFRNTASVCYLAFYLKFVTLASICKVKAVELRSFYFKGASISWRSTAFWMIKLIRWEQFTYCCSCYLAIHHKFDTWLFYVKLKLWSSDHFISRVTICLEEVQ